MREFILLCMSLLFSNLVFGQINCEAFKLSGDLKKYEACQIAEERAGYNQFSFEYQNAFDRALAVDSTFSWAYRYKSTAYLKSGDFITWKQLMDHAVTLDPAAHLDYRGWCRFQFFRDYAGAIEDIERLQSLVSYDIGYSQNGYYHLEIARALCYKGLGNQEKAINIIEKKLLDPDYSPGPYVYLHLGVLYLEKGDFDQSISALKKQENTNDLAENRYYIALAYAKKGEAKAYEENLKLAMEKYTSQLRMFDPYVIQMDKIYLQDLQRQMDKINP